MRAPLKAVLFDLDGTLFDSIDLLLASMRYAFAEFDGVHPTQEDWVAGIGTPLVTQLAAYARSDEELILLRDRYRAFQKAEHDRLARAFPDSLPVLRTLQSRRLAMALVTSKGNLLAQQALDFTGMAPFLPVLVGADSVTKHKPAPEPVLLALSELKVRAEEAVFVGDSPHDVYSGNSAGVVTIAALWGPFSRAQLAESNPTHFLDRLADLPALLETL
jgi:pyrophosphatase PpaX